MHLGLIIGKGSYTSYSALTLSFKVQGGKSLELKHGLQSVEYTGQKGKRGKEMRHHTQRALIDARLPVRKANTECGERETERTSASPADKETCHKTQ